MGSILGSPYFAISGTIGSQIRCYSPVPAQGSHADSISHGFIKGYTWGLPKIRGTFWGVQKTRSVVYWGLYWGSSLFCETTTWIQGSENYYFKHTLVEGLGG